MIFFYFMILIHMCGIENAAFFMIMYTGLAINVAMLFGGILKNPGMP